MKKTLLTLMMLMGLTATSSAFAVYLASYPSFQNGGAIYCYACYMSNGQENCIMAHPGPCYGASVTSNNPNYGGYCQYYTTSQLKSVIVAAENSCLQSFPR